VMGVGGVNGTSAKIYEYRRGWLHIIMTSFSSTRSLSFSKRFVYL
jgi:hypothetical protein